MLDDLERMEEDREVQAEPQRHSVCPHSLENRSPRLAATRKLQVSQADVGRPVPDLSQLLSHFLHPGLLARSPDPRTPEAALRSEVRRRILDVLQEEGSMPVSRLRQRVGLGWGSLYHQLRRMEEAGLVRMIRAGQRQIVVGMRAGEAENLAVARAHIQGDTARRIAELIASGSGLDTARIAEQLKISPRTVRYHIQRLTSAGLVTAASRTRHAFLRATPLLAAALEANQATQYRR